MLKGVMPEGPTIGEIHVAARERLSDRHLVLMEKVIKDNLHKDKYWILGMADCKRKNGRTTIKPVLTVFDVMPELRKNSYLYEVDNTKGTRQLLWVMHPNNQLSLPTIGKTISKSAAD